MLAWGFLVVCVIAGVALLTLRARFPFRGSTLLGFLLLTLGMTSPLALHPQRMMLASGAGQDAFIGVWDLWWARSAVALGMNPLDTHWLFHPNGTSLALHTHALTYGVASLPAQWLLAPAAGPAVPDALFLVYNLILLVSFTLSGYFTYRLALSVTGQRTGSVIAGVLFAFTHFRFANAVRLHVIATELLVLATWAWVVLLRRPSARQLLLWVGAVLLLVYASLEYTAYAALLFIVLTIPEVAAPSPSGTRPHGLLGGLRERARWHRRDWLLAAGGSAVVLLLLAPLLLQLAQRSRQGDTGFDPRLTQFFSADLLDFFLPNPRHPLWGSAFAPISAGFHKGDGGFGLSLGWVTMALGVVTAIALLRAREGRRWLWGSVIFWLLSFGPALHIGGHILQGIPMPQVLLAKVVPFLAGSRTPLRYIAPAQLCLAVMVAAGWAAGRRGAVSTPERRAPLDFSSARLTLAAIGLLLFESLAAPLPMTPVPVPEAYRQIGGAPGSSALVHIPGMPAREDLLYQTVHRQRLVENLENAVPLRSRRGADPFGSPLWIALTRALGDPQWVASLSEAGRTQAASALRDFLRQNQIRWIVLLRARPALTDDGRRFVSQRLLDDATYTTFRQNLRLLGPLREQELGDDTLFEFDAPNLTR